MTIETNTSDINHADEIPSLLSIRQFAEKHKFMSESSLRWLLFRDPPGLEECIVRPSANRLYLNERKFFDFLKHMQASKKSLKRS